MPEEIAILWFKTSIEFIIIGLLFVVGTLLFIIAYQNEFNIDKRAKRKASR